MSNDTATGPITVAVSSSFDQTQPLSDAVHILPSHAIKHLLSAGVCRRCISRLFDIRGDEESTQSLLFQESELCRICLGILQFTYGDNSAKIVKKEDANDFALSIAELVKREGYELDGFSLEVSIPPVILENDRLLWLYLKRKYGSEPWFQENLNVGILVKDALKSAIANPVEHLLDVKSSSTSCRIRLTYTQTNPASTPPDSVGRNEGSKRRKTDTNNGFDAATKELVGANTECFGAYTVQEIAVSDMCSNGLEENGSSDSFNFPLGRVNEPCHLESFCYRTPIFFGGRYLKFSRNVSQSRWIIDDERMGEASVEEIVGGNILPACKGDAYKFHAAGREDIDVRMLGSGRPFLVEIQNARQVPSEAVVKEIETKINNMENRLVRVTNLKLVNNQGWALMREGEAEKQKQYCAVVWVSRLLEDEDLQTIASFKDMQILQRTPIRVLHRRSPLEREKTIHWMKIERICRSSQYFLLHLCTQAGTYIKEFVHGDLGRTQPSIGSILGCRAEILQLDVTDVKMDCFMT